MRGVSPAFFQKLEKSTLTLEKMPWLWSSWVLISHLKYGFMSFQEKKTHIFPCGAFLSCVVDEMFIEMPWFQENSPALKNSWLRAWKEHVMIFQSVKVLKWQIKLKLLIWNTNWIFSSWKSHFNYCFPLPSLWENVFLKSTIKTTEQYP